jgi:hypothetical protein
MKGRFEPLERCKASPGCQSRVEPGRDCEDCRKHGDGSKKKSHEPNRKDTTR